MMKINRWCSGGLCKESFCVVRVCYSCGTLDFRHDRVACRGIARWNEQLQYGRIRKDSLLEIKKFFKFRVEG